MMMFKRIIFGALALLSLTAPAAAQCTGTFAANQFCGSLTGGPPGPRLITAPVISMIGGSVLGNDGTSTGAASDLRAPVLGLNGTAQGSLGLRGSTSGTVTIQPGAAAAGTYNFNLPTAAGTAGFALLSGGGGGAAQSYATLGLPAGGTNAALVASIGGLVYSTTTELAILPGTAVAARIPLSGALAAPSWSTAAYPATAAQGSILAAGTADVISATANPTLGISGTLSGTVTLAGLTSGAAVIRPQDAAGTPQLFLPNTSGTFAVNATSPLVLSSTTGGLTCPTCVTSSGGGAITGVAPVAVSAAGAVSITGAAGTVLAGAAPAFTATPTLGVAGTTVGTLTFANATSGSITLSPVTGALGTRTINLPAASGTVAVSATAPITLSAAGAIGVTGAALTRVDDTNVTLTLGGTPTTALLQATSLTLGWTGQLAMTRGGTGASLTASNGGIVWTDANSMEVLAATATANQMLRSGSNATPGWTTTVWPLTSSAGTVLVSATANTITATATPTFGVAGSTLGSLALAGNTSGTVTIRPLAAAGGYTLTLPPDDGAASTFLQSDGAGNLTWVAAGGSGTVTTLTAGTGIEFSSGATCTTTCTISLSAARQTLPTTQEFLSGSGTYNRPSNVLWIEILAIGGGGGGGGSGSGPGASGAGGATCWNTGGAACTTPVYSAGGGAGGTTGGGTSGGAITGSGTCMFGLAGGIGGPANTVANAIGGLGGMSSVGGGTGSFSVGPSSGAGAVVNSGGGGSGATSGGTAGAGSGGGAGATCRAIINSPAATYTYAVGVGGAGGAAGSGGSGGGAGAAGRILVIEHYGS